MGLTPVVFLRAAASQPRPRLASSASPSRGTAIVRLLAAALLACLGATACSRHAAQSWATTDITSHMPDLKFDLANANNPHLTARDLRGHTVLLYFGYVHCPDVCPMTMTRLMTVVKSLGSAAGKVRILFVSVDPRRDTPALVTEYATAFGPNAIGATGTADQIEALAKRYRVAYQADAPDKDGNYEVMHGKGVYVFDSQGHARLLMTDTDKPEAMEHDLRQLVSS
jgi:protein SCO1/2